MGGGLREGVGLGGGAGERRGRKHGHNSVAQQDNSLLGIRKKPILFIKDKDNI